MPRMTNPETIERHAVKMFGCSYADAFRLNDGIALRNKESKAMAYATQKHAATARGIRWQLSFKDWIDVWESSGKFSMRGVGVGNYCMARNGDEGPYSIKNVQIQLCTINSRDGLFFRFSKFLD